MPSQPSRHIAFHFQQDLVSVKVYYTWTSNVIENKMHLKHKKHQLVKRQKTLQLKHKYANVLRKKFFLIIYHYILLTLLCSLCYFHN
uniref:Uncharacterized protein n=1 Tax=Arundo donax TaxID=35708 RepID=A0A0A9F7S9_ARUDO